MKHLRALLINPFIYDFSAYNFWSKPLGILYLGSILRENGFEISLIDCMEVKNKRQDGRGHYLKEVVEAPEVLKGIQKPFRRYGISKDELRKRLLQVEEPHIILVTTLMTYWYLGTLDTLEILREIFPKSKIVIGGIYPTLCEEHAKRVFSSFDLIVKKGELWKFYKFVEETFELKLHFKPEESDFAFFPKPLFELYPEIDFIPLLTSIGCPFSCTYCAARILNPKRIKRSPQNVLDEISYWLSFGVKRFVLYDDCFLDGKESHAIPLLGMLKNLGKEIEFYNPNALNASLIDSKVARLLFEAGFKEIRLGLETVSPNLREKLGEKLTLEEFERAVSSLKEVGYGGENIKVYIIVGLPFQKFEEVKESIDYVLDLGCKPELAEYSPVPRTALFEAYKAYSRYPLDDEPLFHNNSLYPFAWEHLRDEDIQYLKSYARGRFSSLVSPIQDVPHRTLN